MLTLLMTSVRPDEQEAIDAYERTHEVNIITSPKTINECLELVTPHIDGVVIQQREVVDAQVYPHLAACGIVQIATRTVGYDVIDLALAKQYGLTITNVPAYSPRSVAEHALMQIFRILRRSYLVDDRVRRNDFTWKHLQGKEIHSATIGIIGAGRIGGALARLLHALGARVLAYDIAPNHDLDEVLTFVSKEELLKQSDVVSLHVDLNPTSLGLIDIDALRLMQPHAGLVNASRGPVVVTKDLVEALQQGIISAAALDTVEGEEPLFTQDLSQTGVSDPLIEQLLALPQVILTPHIAFYTNIAVQNMVDIALDDACAILAGKPCDHVVG